MIPCNQKPYTPPPCVGCPPPENVSPCLDGEPCIEVTDAGCVAYTDEPLFHIDVETGDRLNDILRKLDLNHATQAIEVGDTESVHLAGNGLEAYPVTAIVQISPAIDDVENSLIITSNGLFVPTPAEVDEVIMTVETSDSATVDLSGNGTTDSPIVADIKLSPGVSGVDNLLVVNEYGLFVPTPEVVPVTVTVADSGTVTLTGNGEVETPITAEVILDPATNNILSGTSGLLVEKIEFNNGLHYNTSTEVRWGGPLVEDTTIEGNTFKSTLQYSESKFEHTPIKKDSYVEDSSVDTVISSVSQTPGVITNTIVQKTAFNPTVGYIAATGITQNKTMLAIGYNLPITGSTSPTIPPSTSAIAGFGSATAFTMANEISLTSNTAIISSGSLVSGKAYRIVSAGGTFNFSGAANNNVDTTFIANNVVPTWGSGSLELLGNITLSVGGQTAVNVMKSGVFASTYSINTAPNDFGALSILQPGYAETHLFQQTLRNAAPGYIADALMSMRSGSTVKSAIVGVSAPVLVGIGSVPAQTQYTSVTEWVNTTGDSTPQGLMRTYSPYVSFRPVSGVNGGVTKIGINVDLPTLPLDISGGNMRLRSPRVPTSATDTGLAGEEAWDANFNYRCIAANTWKRSPLSTWP